MARLADLERALLRGAHRFTTAGLWDLPRLRCGLFARRPAIMGGRELARFWRHVERLHRDPLVRDYLDVIRAGAVRRVPVEWMAYAGHEINALLGDDPTVAMLVVTQLSGWGGSGPFSRPFTGTPDQVFTAPTTGASYVVPAGVRHSQPKLWGGGGGGSPNAAGGGGGFASGMLDVMPGEVMTVVVAGGGFAGQPGATRIVNQGTPNEATQRQGDGGGSGGGRSEVIQGGVRRLIAAGGGGAGGLAAGGAGGGATGQAGTGSNAGGGGTQTAGGTGPGSAANGSSLTGGAGGDPGGRGGGLNGGGTGGLGQFGPNNGPPGAAGGGGGGAGRFGGGGGGLGGGGGGGGSSQGDTVTSGNLQNAANTGDPHYSSSAGRGGSGGQNGSPGRVVMLI